MNPPLTSRQREQAVRHLVLAIDALCALEGLFPDVLGEDRTLVRRAMKALVLIQERIQQ